MAARQKRGNVSPTLLAFGRQLRRYREAKNLGQDRVAQRANGGRGVTPQYVSQVESGRTRCTREFAMFADELLGAGGKLVDLWEDLVLESAYPTWFDWVPVEAEAISLDAFELAVVHGLAQTRAYAANLLKGNEDAVEARLRRQEILRRAQPPRFSLLLDRGVLYREVGDPGVMREQLDHLIDMQSDTTSIQILPSRQHRGISGSFTIATLADRSEIAHVDSAARGLTMSDAEDVTRLATSFSSMRAVALPVDQSIDLIRKVVSERWT
ncbi:helix-turn-helix domain-containing protein [Actinomadura sediminis]|uniref:Helix-turn-helix domain-containing protein n=1 Tax=Actinomadura sediminis TaxID=1038904 RepID=A0ABW3EQC2_9ACTN